PPRVKELFGERPVHRNDMKVKPLQAADMLAWHIHRRYYDRERGVEFDSPTMRMLNSIPHFDNVWPKERLQALVVDCEERNRKSGMWSLYENQRAEQRLPESITRNNLRLIARATPNSSVLLSPFPAKATRRFRLVDSCPLARMPHLHRRSGNECLAANSIFG